MSRSVPPARPQTADLILAETVLVFDRSPWRDRPARRGAWTRLTAAVAVMALLLAAAVPARAETSGGKVVAGIAALAALAWLVNEAQDQKDRDRPVKRPEKTPSTEVRPLVPPVCALDIGTPSQPARAYSGSCLKTEGFAWALPDRCARPVRLFGKADRIYPADCLQKAGFSTRAR